MQGQTCERLILDLNKRPFSPQIEFHGLNVALSRVKQSRNLRLLPLQPFQTNLNYLLNLKPQLAITNWFQHKVSTNGQKVNDAETQKPVSRKKKLFALEKKIRVQLMPSVLPSTPPPAENIRLIT